MFTMKLVVDLISGKLSQREKLLSSNMMMIHSGLLISFAILEICSVAKAVFVKH